METKQSEITVGLEAQNNVESTYIVEIKNLSKSFGENHVLKDITMSVKKGENLVVLGKSGSGKSVLIKCLVRLMDADAGSIHILGNDITNLKAGARQRRALPRHPAQDVRHLSLRRHRHGHRPGALRQRWS